nr:MAG TPA: hypothetical protein [Caudoviricetes sp.]
MLLSVSCRYIIISSGHFVNTFLYLQETFLLTFKNWWYILE